MLNEQSKKTVLATGLTHPQRKPIKAWATFGPIINFNQAGQIICDAHETSQKLPINIHEKPLHQRLATLSETSEELSGRIKLQKTASQSLKSFVANPTRQNKPRKSKIVQGDAISL